MSRKRADAVAPIPRDPLSHLHIEWFDPESLTPNPANYRTHPEAGTPATAESIRRFGWVKPAIYNRTTGRLIDGHDRQRIAIREGHSAMPVAVVEMSEAEELDLLLTLDRSTTEAGVDRDRLADLLTGFRSPDGPLRDLAARFAAETDLAEFLAGADLSGLVETVEPWVEPVPDKQPPGEFPAFDENLPTDHVCPRCDYRWSGKSN